MSESAIDELVAIAKRSNIPGSEEPLTRIEGAYSELYRLALKHFDVNSIRRNGDGPQAGIDDLITIIEDDENEIFGASNLVDAIERGRDDLSAAIVQFAEQNSGNRDCHGTQVCSDVDVIFMTNGCCEAISESYRPMLELGLESGSFDGNWYPLTDTESQLIGEDHITVGVFPALSGYSVLYQGKKYLNLEIEISFDRYNPEDAVYPLHCAAFAMLCQLAPLVEGIVKWDSEPGVAWDDGTGKFCSALMVPLDYALNQASTYDQWQQFVESRLALSTDR